MRRVRVPAATRVDNVLPGELHVAGLRLVWRGRSTRGTRVLEVLVLGCGSVVITTIAWRLLQILGGLVQRVVRQKVSQKKVSTSSCTVRIL